VASYTLNQWTAGIKYASTFYPLGVRWSMVKELKKTAFKMLKNGQKYSGIHLMFTHKVLPRKKTSFVDYVKIPKIVIYIAILEHKKLLFLHWPQNISFYRETL
jgi:hypothetical protein